MKRVLITGGAGFIGSHTVDLFLEQDIEVVVLDNLSSGKINNINPFSPQLIFVRADASDASALRKALLGCNAVLHLAARPSVAESLAHPLRSLEANIGGFLHVLEAIRQSNDTIRLVYASSAAVYGAHTPLPCDDTIPLTVDPLSPYALEKITNEYYAALYARLYGIKSVGLRYFNVYGARQDPASPYSGVISKFIKQYQQHKPITVFGDGEQSRDFIHVSDIAKANWQAINSDYCGVLNVATGAPETLNQLIHYLELVSGTPAHIEYNPSQLGDIRESYATTYQAEQCLGYRSTVSLIDGIRLFF